MEHKEKDWGWGRGDPLFFFLLHFFSFYGWWHLGVLVRRLTLKTYLFFFKLKHGWLTGGPPAASWTGPVGHDSMSPLVNPSGWATARVAGGGGGDWC